MGTESVALPDGVELKASTCLHHKPASWRGSSLQRRLFVAVAVTLTGFAAAVMIAAYVLGSAIAPFTPSYIHTAGTVISQSPHRFKGGDACRLTLAFALDGQQDQATFETGTNCKGSPQPGSRVQISVNPDNPKDLVVLGNGYFPEQRPWLMGFIGVMWTGLAGLYLWPAASAYRRSRRLFSNGSSWRELTARVRSRSRYKGGTTLVLEAEDVMGTMKTFVLGHNGNGPWKPPPRPGDTLTFALLADGKSTALLSVANDSRLRLVGLSVPNNFELRAMGL